MTRRTAQINELIKTELAPIIQREYMGSKFGMVTITNVETSPDLSQATVWVSLLNGTEDGEGFLKNMEKRIYHIQGELNRTLHVKKNPRLVFKIDKSSDYIENLENILQDMHKKDT